MDRIFRPLPQAQAAQQGGSQIVVQPARGNTGVGGTPTVPGRVTHGHGAISHYYSGISLALERLAPIMTNADTSRNLRWKQTMAGDATKLTMWKMEAKSSPGLQFYAYMQPGKFFMVVRHSMEKKKKSY